MDFGRGFLLPHESDFQIRRPWIPVTPEKPIPSRSNPITMEREGNYLRGNQPGRESWKEREGSYNGGNQMGRENWTELMGMYSGFLQENTSSNGGVPDFDPIRSSGLNEGSYSLDFAPAEKIILNHNVGSYVENYGNDSAAWNNNPLGELLGIKNQVSVASGNGMPSTSVHFASRSTIPNSNSQVDSNWTDTNSASRLLANQNFPSDPNWRISGDRFIHMPKDGFPVPYRPNYNLNSPPRSEPDAASCLTGSFLFAPVTPDQAKRFENERRSDRPSFSIDESSSQEKDKQENLFRSIGNEAIEIHCSELLQNIVDSSSAAISTPLKESNKSGERGDLGIDLNATPQQKTPKRRKHRPKVIVEGKPKRAPKSTTPKNTKENSSGKRKYVRKSSVNAPVPQNPNVRNGVSVPNAEAAAKSCRRELNFDLGHETSASRQPKMHQERSAVFNLNLDSQATGLWFLTNNESGTSTPNNGNSKEYPSGNWNYVSNNGLKDSVAENLDAVNELTVRSMNFAAKSCRRELNFDLDNAIRDKSREKSATEENSAAFNLNLNSQASEGNTFTDYTLINSNNQVSARSKSLLERPTPSAPIPTTQNHTLNANARRGVNMEIPISCQSSGKYVQTPVHQQTCREVDKVLFHSNTSRGQVMWPGTPQLAARNIVNLDETRGSKRELCQTGPPLLRTQLYRVDDQNNNNGGNLGTGCPETHKRKKYEHGFQAITSRSQLNGQVRDCSGQGEERGGNDIFTDNSRSEINSSTLSSFFGSGQTPTKLKNGVNADNNSPKQVVSSELNPKVPSTAMIRFQGSTQVYDQRHHNAVTNWNPLSSTPPKKALSIMASHANVSAKKLPDQSSSNPRSSGSDKMRLQDRKEVSRGHQQSFMNPRDPRENQKYPAEIDFLIYRLQRLSIHGGSNGKVEQKALVPYKGAGTVVPYEGFDIKRRKPRPKVDLDPESNRVWKLLMEKDGNECFDGENKDKEKWWEEQREMFRGRADSFIARMHLVQGDRRFSRWKGSVVDSVIGVFLTQNVSDHLSSSAFMSLAAKFPPKAETTEKKCFQIGPSILVEEPVDQITRQPSLNGTYLASNEISERIKDNLTPRPERTTLSNEHNRRAEEEPISSQSAFRSFSLQSGKVGSFMVSNSEAEDPRNMCRPDNFCGPTLTNILHTQKTTSFEEFRSHTIGSSLSIGGSNNGSEGNPRSSSMFTHPINANIPGMQRPFYPSSDFQLHMTSNSRTPELNNFGLLEEQRLSSLSPSAYGITKMNGSHHMSKRISHFAESTTNTAFQQNGVARIQSPTAYPSAYLSQHPTHQECFSRPVPHSAKDHLFLNFFQEKSTVAKEPLDVVQTGIKQCEVRGPHQESFMRPVPRNANDQNGHQHKSTCTNEPLTVIQTGTKQQIPNDPLNGSNISGEETNSFAGKQKWLEKKVAEVNAKVQVSSSVEASSGTSPNVSNAKKRKAEEEKRNQFDWDSLRKQVEPNSVRKERNKDATDSLDYEALRCAEVKEISDAIKERGMNNLLADRIQDFLNRLVREHGSIDLEWLRDVPPDKAKEFLLSIRGLGLKSVECVRLLTLHHLAFPVDTNVGRIAVRLGWVPLQPLPEELQLHLLEMYPLLETIQKYLWPRLCKLDQRTLYELHYQMITFGKVFCTKSKPNCNACPMRAECRHFASAFASARLALPGPEDKTLANTSVPIPTNKSPTVTIKPMPLPPPEINFSTNESWFVTKPCEPIVEEPTTPEEEFQELTQSDIEDAYYDDPEEIPTINLNIEEFTENLHKYMEQNMELQEGDMSKALVVLNQAAASIPAPKLKNVSRLRTEHQVYELPDSHPLLKGMDLREPDDPSPYLLAIWTPGETANSIQPSEKSCGSQETGMLCGDTTCFSCNCLKEADSLTVRGTILIPCRTATRGSFPLNGTYFQVNEVFADHESSLNPINVPRRWLWNLSRRTVYFGTSVSTIFKGLSTEGIQYCFWRGFVCVRGFDKKTRAPRPLMARLHFPASKLVKTKNAK